MVWVDVICSSLLNSIIRPKIPCGMCPNSPPPLCFDRVNVIQNTFECPIKWFSLKLNLQSE